MTFKNPDDYDKLNLLDHLKLEKIRTAVENGTEIYLTVTKTGEKIALECPLSERQRDMLLCGGLLNYTRKMN